MPGHVEVEGTWVPFLGGTVRETDIDENWDEVSEYSVQNVPSVAIEGKPDSTVVGAFHADGLVERLAPFV